MVNNSIVMTSVRDFFTLKMMKYSVLPFIATMVVMYILFFYFAGNMLEHLHQATLQVSQSQTTLNNGVTTSNTYSGTFEGSSILTFLMSHVITAWIFSFFFYVLGSMFILAVSILMAIIVIAFLTPYILKELQRKHYQDVQMKGHGNILLSFWHIFKSLLIAIVLLVLFIPFYFIPILNVFMLNLPIYYFFHKILTYDVASSIVTEDENKKIFFFSGNKIRIRTFILYLISLIPFAVLFGGVFYVIFIGHTYFIEAKKLRSSSNTHTL
jgi:hypothetical protein